MKSNMGNTDKIVRIIAAILFFMLFFTGSVTGMLGTVLLVLGGIFLVTSIIGFCPIYAMLGLRTNAKKS